MAGSKVVGKYSGMGGRLLFQDPQNSNATVLPVAGVYFMDHFLGKIIDVTNTWTLIDTAGGTETLKANQPGGVVELLLAATSEAELAGIAWGDVLSFTLNRGLNFEARVRFTTLPTGTTIFAAGMISATNASVDAIATAGIFRADGSGAITVECDDGTIETSKVATGVSFLVNEWHVLRVSYDDPASVRFYIDGSQVASGTTFNMSTTPTAQLQPTVRIGKEGADTSLGVVEVDYVQVWQNLS